MEIEPMALTECWAVKKFAIAGELRLRKACSVDVGWDGAVDQQSRQQVAQRNRRVSTKRPHESSAQQKPLAFSSVLRDACRLRRLRFSPCGFFIAPGGDNIQARAEHKEKVLGKTGKGQGS